MRGRASWAPKITGPRHNFPEGSGFFLESSQFIPALDVTRKAYSAQLMEQHGCVGKLIVHRKLADLDVTFLVSLVLFPGVFNLPRP